MIPKSYWISRVLTNKPAHYPQGVKAKSEVTKQDLLCVFLVISKFKSDLLTISLMIQIKFR